MPKIHTVWLIDEGQTGHRVQSEGMVQALQSTGLRLETKKIGCQFRLRGFLRPAARTVFALLDDSLAVKLAGLVSPFSEPPTSPPTFIVSSGGRTAFVSRALALRTGAPNVFIGNPAPFPTSWFSVVVTPLPVSTGDAIPTGVFPNLSTPEQCAARAHTYWNGNPPQRVWTLLIGGARRRDHMYDAQDWRDIADGINALSARYGIKWLITTSRRTGKEAEAILEANLSPGSVEELVLYGREQKPVTQAFLGASDRVFVTRDSLTMVSEAIMSGRPVTALLPRRVGRPSDTDLALFRKLLSDYNYNEIHCHVLINYELIQLKNENKNYKSVNELYKSALQLAKKLELRCDNFDLEET